MRQVGLRYPRNASRGGDVLQVPPSDLEGVQGLSIVFSNQESEPTRAWECGVLSVTWEVAHHTPGRFHLLPTSL